MDMYDRIEVLLKTNRMNKKELCARTGISYNTLASLFKRRSKNVELETIRKIACCLNTTVEYLVTGNENYFAREEQAADARSNSVIVISADGTQKRFDLTEAELQAVLTILDGMKK